MPEENVVFEIDTVSDRSTGTLSVVDYADKLALAHQIVDGIYLGKITNDAQKKSAKDTRATLNKIKEAIERKRIDSVSDFTIDFENQMKEIAKVFDDAQKTLGANVKEYQDSTKIAVSQGAAVTKYTAKLTFTDKKIIADLTAFCEKRNIALEIK